MTREEAAKILNRFFSGIILPRCSGKRMLKEAVDTAFEALKQPEQKEGKWIDKGTYCVCSLCQHTESPQYDNVQPIPRFTPFCSMCGAKMEVAEE